MANKRRSRAPLLLYISYLRLPEREDIFRQNSSYFRLFLAPEREREAGGRGSDSEIETSSTGGGGSAASAVATPNVRCISNNNKKHCSGNRTINKTIRNNKGCDNLKQKKIVR